MQGIIDKAAGARRLLGAVARRGLHPGLLVNVGAPFGTYRLLTEQGLPPAQALLATAVFPLGTILARAVRSRRLDPIGALSLAAIAVGVVGTMVFHSPRLLLVKDSLLTGLLGLACLASLLAARPLFFLLGRQFAAGGRAAYEARWAATGFRAVMRRLTLVWGLAFLAEASLRIALSFIIAPAALLAVSPLLAIATFGPLGLWTMRRAAARPAQRAAAA